MKIEKRCKTRTGHFNTVPIDTREDGSMSLLLPEIPEAELREMLPNVSIVTITKDRGAFSGIMLYNWMNIKYPREKLEWVILDDSEENVEYDLRDYIPQEDPYINYVRLKEWLPIADKRNKAVSLAKYDYIVHMDDDDYYFPDHVLSKIRIILQYNCQGVHSLPIGVYDMMERSSYIFDPKKVSNMDNNDVAEATLAYRKSYWKKNKFYSTAKNGGGEGKSFINNNFSYWMNLHFLFNSISITHTKNVTEHNRRLINENEEVKVGNFEDVLPPSFRNILDNIRKIIEKDYVQPDI